MARFKGGGGTFAFVGMDTGRFSDFSTSCMGLVLPPRWQGAAALNYDCASSCNHHVEHFTGDHLLLMGDDHTFPRNLIHRLVCWNVDIVAALVMERRPPFNTVARDFDGLPLRLEGEPGLIEVGTTGTAGMLIHRRVFDAIEPPWFWNGVDPESGMRIADDMFFCAQARAAGFKIHVDTSTIISHLAVLNVAPVYEDGEWTTRLSVNEREFLAVKTKQRELVHG